MAGQVRAMKLDPYRNFRFKVVIDNKIVAGLSKMSGLKKTTEGIDWWEAGDNFNARRLPGKTKYEAITLERGLTDDPVFEQWADHVNRYKGNTMAENFRKLVQLHICDHTGAAKIKYNIYECWVSEFQAVPALDASQNGVAIQTIKIEHEGFEREGG